MTEAVQTEAVHTERVDFRVSPDRYKHWRLSTDGPVATLTMDVDEQGGLVPGYELKLNSYDLGVDIELYDAVQRLRFEHPEIGAVVLTSGKERVFCAGANIRMLGQSSHGFKVNFCKFTNETRNAIEEASGESKQAWLCVVNGPCAGCAATALTSSARSRKASRDSARSTGDSWTRSPRGRSSPRRPGVARWS